MNVRWGGTAVLMTPCALTWTEVMTAAVRTVGTARATAPMTGRWNTTGRFGCWMTTGARSALVRWAEGADGSCSQRKPDFFFTQTLVFLSFSVRGWWCVDGWCVIVRIPRWMCCAVLNATLVWVLSVCIRTVCWRTVTERPGWRTASSASAWWVKACYANSMW